MSFVMTNEHKQFIKKPSSLRTTHLFPVLPEVYQIEVARKCNLHCLMCSAQFFPRKNEQNLIHIDLVKKIVDEGDLEGSFFVEFQMSGEPLLHPELADIIDIVKCTGVKTGLSTNGTLMDHQLEALSKLDYITFSLDSIDDYERIRLGYKGENFNLIQNIKDFLPVANRNGISIDVQLIELEGWEEQFKKVSEIFKGDNVLVRTVPNGLNLHFFPEMENPSREICLNPFMSASIQCTGEVTACCFSMGDDIQLGNLYYQTLKEIWEGEEIKKLREEHMSRNYRQICSRCYMRSPFLFHWRLYLNSIQKRNVV